jgi:phosphoribosylaminoimidazole carboxylase (NCAIR synthetase)
VNETAPRVHNSGHHTIEAHYSSQFDMLWRVMLDYPLGNTDAILPSIMVNIIGAEGCNGDVKYEGLEDVMKIDNAFVHIYGKKQTKPGRKWACHHSKQRKTRPSAQIEQSETHFVSKILINSFYPPNKPFITVRQLIF